MLSPLSIEVRCIILVFFDACAGRFKRRYSIMLQQDAWVNQLQKTNLNPHVPSHLLDAMVRFRHAGLGRLNTMDLKGLIRGSLSLLAL